MDPDEVADGCGFGSHTTNVGVRPKPEQRRHGSTNRDEAPGTKRVLGFRVRIPSSSRSRFSSVTWTGAGKTMLRLDQSADGSDVKTAEKSAVQGAGMFHERKRWPANVDTISQYGGILRTSRLRRPDPC